ncbi:hypothetical protein GLYMA_19G046766v4 [Glycine max]|nr:hypothetical protein GLYMA_19G046766v4 [Glycine max]
MGFFLKQVYAFFFALFSVRYSPSRKQKSQSGLLEDKRTQGKNKLQS